MLRASTHKVPDLIWRVTGKLEPPFRVLTNSRRVPHFLEMAPHLDSIPDHERLRKRGWKTRHTSTKRVPYSGFEPTTWQLLYFFNRTFSESIFFHVLFLTVRVVM